MNYALRALKQDNLVDEGGKLKDSSLRIFLRNKKTGQIEEQFMEGSAATEKEAKNEATNK